MQQILFEEHKLPVLKKTKTGAQHRRRRARRTGPISIRCRPRSSSIGSTAKLKNTYVDALPPMVHPTTGRVHASFNQVVAATGRLSSSDPNLQNIPIRTEEGREIRSAFLPGHEGWKLLAADYSQIELRVLAHFRRRSDAAEAFARDEDIHARVASQVYNVPLDEVTSDKRRRAKAVNFGVIYGQSPFGLAKGLGISQAEAAAFIDAYFDRYRASRNSSIEILEECRRKGYVSTILGRRRAIQAAFEHDSSSPIGPAAAEPARTDRDQHGHPRLGGRLDQAGHDQHPSPADARKSWPRGCCCKSTTNWSSKSRRTNSMTLAQLVRDEMSERDAACRAAESRLEIRRQLGGVRAVDHMITFGIVGGVASGKSLVSEQLAELARACLMPIEPATRCWQTTPRSAPRCSNAGGP